MARITLTQDQINAFKNANNAFNPKSAKKALWAALRTQYNIPADVKLGFEDFAGTGYRQGDLYVKGSSPRNYIDEFAYQPAPVTATETPTTDAKDTFLQTSADALGSLAESMSAVADSHASAPTLDEVRDLLADLGNRKVYLSIETPVYKLTVDTTDTDEV